MPRVEKKSEARADLLEIFEYLGQHSLRAADRFVDAFEKASERLADMPELGGLCESDHPKLAGTRLWPIKKFPKYLILYRPLPDGIEVLRVFHGSRDLESMFDE